MPEKKHLEELAQFIREHRNNEDYFQALYDQLVAECEAQDGAENPYAHSLRETFEKQAATYKENKEKGISSWSEFENMVSHFEKTVTDALNQ